MQLGLTTQPRKEEHIISGDVGLRRLQGLVEVAKALRHSPSRREVGAHEPLVE